mmetsp:Transcript_2089/g.4431  ORF Transcript_2089/g.4431 Transcript_2089/m.4431 type:complete len:204 (-) Transcript_2089:2568-3179(-)
MKMRSLSLPITSWNGNSNGSSNGNSNKVHPQEEGRMYCTHHKKMGFTIIVMHIMVHLQSFTRMKESLLPPIMKDILLRIQRVVGMAKGNSNRGCRSRNNITTKALFLKAWNKLKDTITMQTRYPLLMMQVVRCCGKRTINEVKRKAIRLALRIISIKTKLIITGGMECIKNAISHKNKKQNGVVHAHKEASKRLYEFINRMES